jgi:hypothetical protein
MFMRLRILAGMMFAALLLAGNLLAQQTVLLWEDNFDDTATDPNGVINVGWARAGVADGLVNSFVGQRDNEMHARAGVFSNLVGAVQFQSNGVPFINPLDPAATKRALLRQPPYGNPNSIITFKIMFMKITGTFVAVAARMPFNDTTAAIPVANVTVVSAYTLTLNLLQDSVKIAEHSGPLAALAPENWTYFSRRPFDFNLNQYYWVKFYLNGGDLKAKVWQGALQNEPAAWLAEGTDPTPRVEGEWITFAMFGAAAAASDSFKIDSLRVEGFGTTAVETGPEQVPARFALEQNYPNPFNPATQIRYTLAEAAHTRLEVYNLAGRKVRTLVAGYQTAGSHYAIFDGKDDAGAALVSGVYFYRLSSNKLIDQKKLLLLK